MGACKGFDPGFLHTNRKQCQKMVASTVGSFYETLVRSV